MARIDFQKNDTYRKSFGGVLKIQKHVDSESDLPETGASEGDIYTVGESDTMMLYHNGEFKPMGSGESVSWNDVTDKPFYTTTYPSIDLPNGIKLVIDGYIREGAQPDDTTGVYDVYDTRFDIQLMSRVDNSVLKSLVGVIPGFVRNHSLGFIVAIENDYDEMHMTDNLGQKGVLMLNLGRIEPSSFNDTVRSWDGNVSFHSEMGTTFVTDILLATPAKASAVKGQDYDTVTVESALNGYTSYFKRNDYVKKIDTEYLPNPYALIRIKGDPSYYESPSELEAMGVTKELIDSVVNGYVGILRIGLDQIGTRDYKVIYAGTDPNVFFECENTDYFSDRITHTKFVFGYYMQDGECVVYCNQQKDLTYWIQSGDSGDGGDD